MPPPSPHNIPASLPYLPRPSRIPRLCSSKEIPNASERGPDGQVSLIFDQITSTPRYYDVKPEASLAAKLRAKLHAISPRQPINTVSTFPEDPQALRPSVKDSLSSEPIEISNANTTFLETDQDQDFHSQSATLVESESPQPQSAILIPPRNEPTRAVTIVRPLSKFVGRNKKKVLKHPFRVDKLRLFLNNTRIGWNSTIPMLQMSPRIIILDVSVQDKKMAVTFALREDILAIEQHDGRGKYDTLADIEGLTIGDKLKRAKEIALDKATDERVKILALEEVLNDVEVSAGELGDWLLDEIEDVSTIYGRLLGMDEIDMQMESIMAENKVRVPQLDDPEELWLFDEERDCVGQKGLVWY
ncbi:hypothetical protein TWF506_008349 [Arthrobotrys conoides]|uniref:Uncharacterized protein n=1 Tax=Arthrobotrys conoides TaxID=74498 RepID=A0AAN8RS07_9PEZI